MKPSFSPLTLATAVLTLAACTVGPDYQKPDLSDITPAKWSWQAAAPRDDTTRGEWWKVFHDGELNRLETLAMTASPSLKIAVARVNQARAGARLSTSGWLPDVRFKEDIRREQTSANLPTPVPVNIPRSTFNTFSTVLDFTYEIDFWGKIRREVESARATADAASASYYSALLTLTGDVAAQYFLLRAADAELDALRRTIALREQLQKLLDEKFRAGVVTEIDLARSQTEVATARAELADMKRQRQEASDTLALLCGQAASTFRISERPIASKAPPGVPAGLPADILERRPDIAAAERLVAARNAEIGVAKAAYFPAVKLTGTGGYLTKDIDNLLSGDSRIWSVGPGVNIPVSGWFVIHHNVRRLKAAREEAIGNYRLAVLAAVRDVETSLAQIRYLREQSSAVDDAVAAASRATDLIRTAYESGSLSYLELLDAERTRLQAERQTARVAAQRHIATVRLIKAMGGGW